jgi:hypothetical protein
MSMPPGSYRCLVLQRSRILVGLATIIPFGPVLGMAMDLSGVLSDK